MQQKPFVIGIAGKSGSGKTAFIQSFVHHFKENEITLISQDDYYFLVKTKTQEENKLYNFDVPSTIDRAQFYKDFTAICNGESVYKEKYLFNNSASNPETLVLKSAPIIIIEGLFIFYYEEINALLDQRIFIDSEDEVALQRRIKRDFEERGYPEDDVRYKWIHHVIPSYEVYLLPFKSQCDHVVENSNNTPDELFAFTKEYSNFLRNKMFT